MSSDTTSLTPTDERRVESRPLDLILFELDQQPYVLALEYVQEIVPLPALVTLPSSPEIVEGFLRLDGNAIPVLRLDRLLGLPTVENQLYTPLLVLKGDDLPLALLVHRVNRVVAVNPDALIPVSAGSTVNDCAQGMTEIDGRMAIVLDRKLLLLEQEEERLRALKESAEQRIGQLEGASQLEGESA